MGGYYIQALAPITLVMFYLLFISAQSDTLAAVNRTFQPGPARFGLLTDDVD